MIQALYSAVMRLLQPFMQARLRRRGQAEPGYLMAPNERWGVYAGAPEPTRRLVWIHAVSLGETRAAAVLIERLRLQLPGMALLLTHGTATGREEGKKLLNPGDLQVWQPWDTPAAVTAFLHHFKPRIGILMETEVWPNLALLCQAKGIPLVLVNARLSEKSLQKAMRLAWIARPAYRSLRAVFAQTQDDAMRLRQLGATVQGVFGNLKFDANPNANQLARGRALRLAMGRPVLLFASSREGEEAALLQLLQAAQTPGSSAQAAQWLIVPRHPQRFDEVAGIITRYGFQASRRSTWGDALPLTDATAAAGQTHATPTIWLGDSLGEMALYYGLADMALLGGSFERFGGQNLIEAAACACPVVMGPHTFNFAEAADLAEVAGAALRVKDLSEAVSTALTWATDEARLGAARTSAEGFARAHQGATDKLVRAIDNLLPPMAQPDLPQPETD